MWIKRFFSRKNRVQSGTRRVRLGVEQLEARDLPSLVIIPTFASSITSDPNVATIEATINTAIQNIESAISNSIRVDITFREMSSGLGLSQFSYDTVSYSAYRSALASHSSSAVDALALTTLPTGAANPVNGNSSINLQIANAVALGLDSGTAHGTINLNTSACNLTRTNINPGKFDLLAVTAHEIDEVLGFGSALDGLTQGSAAPTGPVSGDDLYRYDQSGNRSFNTNASTKAFYSINGGTADLAQFNQSESGDMSDWASGGPPKVQDAFAAAGATPNLGIELTRLDVLGYTLNPSVTSVSPSGGPPAGGTTVTIKGTNFIGVTAVTFGTVPATSFTVLSGTQISAVVPAQTAGSVDVIVTTSGGPTSATAADLFTYSSAYYEVADFRGYGVYLYANFANNGLKAGWQSLGSTPDAAVLGVDGSGNVVANFDGYGLFRFTPGGGWTSLTPANANLLSVAANGTFAANFYGYGVFSWSAGAGFQQITPLNASLLGIDNLGDVFADFPGYGVQKFNSATGWNPLGGPDATLLAVDSAGNVVANFAGYGLQRFTTGPSWSSMGTPDTTALAIDAQGDIAANFSRYGVYQFNSSTANWTILTNIRASLVALDINGTAIIDISPYGLMFFNSKYGWQSDGTPDAYLLAANQV